MNRKALSVICWFAVILGVPAIAASSAAATAERVLTLDESVASGLNNNQGFLALREQVQLAQQMVNEAGAQIYPKIDLNINASRFKNDIPAVLSPSFGTIYLPAVQKDTYYSTRLSLWQYLYAGGRYTTNVRLAEMRLSQAKSRADAEKNKVVLMVRKAFFTCLVSRDKAAACDEALREVSDAEKLRSLQRSSDLLHHQYERDLLRFLKTVGLELDSRIELSGELTPVHEDYDLNKCLAWAYQFRPELRQTQFQENIDSLRVNLSITERYPTVTLGANYEWAGDNVPLNEENWNATINLNLPLFDGWASWARIKQRRIQARESQLQRAMIEDQIRYEVRDALVNYTYWRGRAEAAAREPFSRDPLKRLDGSLERIDTLSALLESHAELEWAMGKILK